MENVLNVLILVAIAAVSITLGLGIFSLYRGGDFARSNSNKLMRLRVALQAAAIVLLLFGLWWKSTHAG